MSLRKQAASCEGEDFKRVKVEKFEVGKVRSWKRSKLKKKSTLQKFEVGNVQRIKWR